MSLPPISLPQLGLRAVPFNEPLDRVPVPSLSIDRTEAVQDRRFRLVQVRQAQNCFGNAPFPFPDRLFAIRRGPPGPRTDDGLGSRDEWRAIPHHR